MSDDTKDKIRSLLTSEKDRKLGLSMMLDLKMIDCYRIRDGLNLFTGDKIDSHNMALRFLLLNSLFSIDWKVFQALSYTMSIYRPSISFGQFHLFFQKFAQVLPSQQNRFPDKKLTLDWMIYECYSVYLSQFGITPTSTPI